MSEMVRVWNKNKFDYSEQFKNKMITVPAGQFIMMELFEATEFKGKYPGKGVIKMIKIEKIPGQQNKTADIQVCNMCGKEFFTEKTLFEHLKTHNPEDRFQDIEEEKPKRRGRPKVGVNNDSSANTGNDKSAD
jgi:hypothetical protein